MTDTFKIIESPREGMQSLSHVIPTHAKVGYLRALLRVGFDTVELGSIVSPRLIPQMADTPDVVRELDFTYTRSNRMILVASKKGAETAAGMEGITHISFPFSISPTFLKLNLNSTIAGAIDTVKEIAGLCESSGKTPVIYMSMAFGNPYGDPWSISWLESWIVILAELGIKTIPLSNVSTEIDRTLIAKVFSRLIRKFPDVEFGLHLHTANVNWEEKVLAAWDNGCRRFDSVILGYGGCPMSGREMLGNLKTENLLAFSATHPVSREIDQDALREALTLVGPAFMQPFAGFGGKSNS